MKPSINPAAVAAIATAAFLAHNPNYRDELSVEHPERVASDLLGLDDLLKDVTDDAHGAVVAAFDCALAFALQAGALVGAEPLHLPDLKDLIAQYRLKRQAKAA